MNVGTSTNDRDMCLIDSATTHTILENNKFYSCLVIWEVNVSIISSTTNIFEGSRKANILLPKSLTETY